jgi:hypothetical protein
MHPREFHSIKKNMFNIVTVLDLTNTNTLGFVSASIMNLINRGYPFRFGLVPIVETEGSLKMARLLYWLNDAYGTQMSMTFLKRVSSSVLIRSVVGKLNCGVRSSSRSRIPSKPPSIGTSSGGNSQISS